MRLYTVLALTALLITSCKRSDEQSIAPSHTIRFGTSIIDVASRVALDQEMVNAGRVYIHGVRNNTAKIFSDTPITRGSDGIWTPVYSSDIHEWINGHNYSFYGYAYKDNDNRLSISKEGLTIDVVQPFSYEPANMVDYMLSHTFRVSDGTSRPLVSINLEHAMSLVDIYLLKKQSSLEAYLSSITINDFFYSATMQCTSQATTNSGNRNIWAIEMTETDDCSYSILGDLDSNRIALGTTEQTTAAHMQFMAIPQQLDARVELTVSYYVNEKIEGAEDNFKLYTSTFLLHNYTPYVWEPGHHIIYTLTIDPGIQLDGRVAEWKDGNYIEGTVLPEIK